MPSAWDTKWLRAVVAVCDMPSSATILLRSAVLLCVVVAVCAVLFHAPCYSLDAVMVLD